MAAMHAWGPQLTSLNLPPRVLTQCKVGMRHLASRRLSELCPSSSSWLGGEGREGSGRGGRLLLAQGLVFVQVKV